MDPGVRCHGMKANPTRYLWSKYECFLMSGCQDIDNQDIATFVVLPFQYDPHGTFTRLVWLYKKANFPLLKDKIVNFDWSCLNDDPLDEACKKFTDVFLNMVKLCIPSKSVVIRPYDKPWYDSEIRHYSSKRDRAKRKLAKSNSPILKENYRKLRNKVNNLKKQAKERFF